MGVDRVDVLFLHDAEEHFGAALHDGYPALAELRSEGVVGAIGAGMYHAGMLTTLVQEADVDVVMLAGRYTLLEQHALDDLLPACAERGVSVLAAAVFNSGLLAERRPADGARFDYEPAAAELLQRASRIADVCEAHGVTLPQAALAFPLAIPSSPASSSACAGPRRRGATSRRTRPACRRRCGPTCAARACSTSARRSPREDGCTVFTAMAQIRGTTAGRSINGRERDGDADLRRASALDGLVREGDGVLLLGLEDVGEDAWAVLRPPGSRLLRVARGRRGGPRDRRGRRAGRGRRRAAGPGADRRGARASRAGRRARRGLRRSRLATGAARGARLRAPTT